MHFILKLSLMERKHFSIYKSPYVGDMFQKVFKLCYRFENLWPVQLAWNLTVTHGQTM